MAAIKKKKKELFNFNWRISVYVYVYSTTNLVASEPREYCVGRAWL